MYTCMHICIHMILTCGDVEEAALAKQSLRDLVKATDGVLDVKDIPFAFKCGLWGLGGYRPSSMYAVNRSLGQLVGQSVRRSVSQSVS